MSLEFALNHMEIVMKERREAVRFGIQEDRAVDYRCDEDGTALNYEVVSDTVRDVRACHPIHAS